MVMDARSGKVLRSRNADTRLHPASLTKMMTLYIAFDYLNKDKLEWETLMKVSKIANLPVPLLGCL